MKKSIKYLLLGIGIALFIGMPWIVVQLFAGISGGGTSSSSAPEGTAVLSTGEAGGTKFLREDGDGTSSWQAGGSGVTSVTGTTPITSTEGTTPAIGITVAKDLVTTAPLTGGTDNILTGADADITIAIPAATSIANGYLTSADWSTFNGKASTTTPTFTGTATFNGDINSTGTITADKFVGTGTGLSSLPSGIVINADGGSDDSLHILQVKTNTEDNMIRTSAAADTMTLGGVTNGIMVAKGGAMDFIGTAAGNEIGGLLWEKSFTIVSSSQTYAVAGSSVCLITKTPKAVTITNIEVTLDADPILEFTGDLKYCDTFIGLANPTLVNDLDTTSGARSDSSITSGSVAAGKCLYLNYDVSPDTNTKQMAITLTGKYN